MSNYKRFTGTGGDFFKFETVGQVLEGTYVSHYTNDFDNENIVMNVNGHEKKVGVTYGMMELLEDAFGALDNIPVGVGLRFEFVGLGPQKKGRKPFKKFALDIDHDTLPDGFELGAEKDDDDEEIPF